MTLRHLISKLHSIANEHGYDIEAHAYHAEPRGEEMLIYSIKEVVDTDEAEPKCRLILE